MWERQFNLQQNQLENTTSLCNTLLRDQQTLISVLLNRTENSQSSFAQGTYSVHYVTDYFSCTCIGFLWREIVYVSKIHTVNRDFYRYFMVHATTTVERFD